MAEAIADGQPAQGRGEEPGGEGVARAHGRDDVHVQGPHEGDDIDDVLAEVGPVPHPLVDGRPAPALLHDQDVRLGQRLPDGSRAAQPPCGPCLVVTDEHDVGAAREVQQDAGPLRGVPQSGAVVDVEGDERTSGAARRQLAQQTQTAVGERRRDAGEVQHAPRAERDPVHGVGRHRRGRGARAVVRHLVGVGGAVARRAEVDAGGAGGVALYGGGVDAVRADRLGQVVAEAVGAHPADPLRGVAGGGQYAGHVGLRAADRPVEGRHVREAARAGREERDHGLAEGDDIHGGRGGRGGGSGGGHDGLGSLASVGLGGFVDPALAEMLDSSKRDTQ